MTCGLRRHPWLHDRGSSAVEFALILPLLLTILFGIIDFGRLEYERITVTQAAFEGARASGFKKGDPAITAAVNAGASPLSVTFTVVNANCTTADTATVVTVSRGTPFVWYTPVLRFLNTTVSASGAFRCLS